MRKFREPTCRNLLKRPLVMGVPLQGLLFLALIIVLIQVFPMGTSKIKDTSSLVIAGFGFIALRFLSRFAKNGFEESLIFWVERAVKVFSRMTIISNEIQFSDAKLEIQNPDTSDERELLEGKLVLEKQLKNLQANESLRFVFESSKLGMSSSRLGCSAKPISFKTTMYELSDGFFEDSIFVYSLFSLPASTDPFWIFSELSSVRSDFEVVVTFKGLDPLKIKRSLEGARLRNSISTSIDSEVSFEEASKVLEGIVRGDDGVVEVSMIIVSKIPLPELNPSYFLLEKNKVLAVSSALGVRKRGHRSHIVRVCTACDLAPTVFDPHDSGTAILKSKRGRDCYFDPMDSRLEALHWIVSGATGAGKSFFTGLVLRRLVQSGRPMSVLFVDHGRSFRRLVKKDRGSYLEPDCFSELEASVSGTLSSLNESGTITGIELSDLPIDQKKKAVALVLIEIEKFLKKRKSLHSVYIVLDECWNYIQSEPLLVQRAFREYRKLNGAVVAITQSIGDFLTQEVGQAIFQNAPIRILLRQGEDLNENKRRLGLNQVELDCLQSLSRKKGVFAECLIKTPFLSRLGQLHPTSEEHDLLRTDNLREEYVNERLKVVANG